MIRSTVSAVFQKISNIANTHTHQRKTDTSTNKRPLTITKVMTGSKHIFSPVLRARRLQSFFRPRICVGNHFGPVVLATPSHQQIMQNLKPKPRRHAVHRNATCSREGYHAIHCGGGRLVLSPDVLNLDCVHVVTSSFAFSFLPYLLLFYVV